MATRRDIPVIVGLAALVVILGGSCWQEALGIPPDFCQGDSDCPNGQRCCGGSCHGYECCYDDQCPGTCESCIWGSCEDNDDYCWVEGCYRCQDGDCVYTCRDGECCDGGICRKPSDWSPTYTVGFEVDPIIKEKFNKAIQAIPGLSGVSLSEVVVDASARWRGCCDRQTLKHEICCEGSLTLSVDLLNQPILAKTVEARVELRGWGASVYLTIGGSVTGRIAVQGTAGTYINECSGSGCLYGSGSIAASLSPALGIKGCCCVKLWGEDHCSPQISATGQATISITGSIRNNQCGQCDGLHGELVLGDCDVGCQVQIGPCHGSATVRLFDGKKIV